MTTIAVGLITEAIQAEAIVAQGKADMVTLARGFLWDPRWAWHAAAELGATRLDPAAIPARPPGLAYSAFSPALRTTSPHLAISRPM